MIKANYNKDGSIKKVVIAESVNQGNNNVNTISINIEDMDATSQTCKGEFILPDQSKVEINATYNVSDEVFEVTLPNTVTLYPGILLINFVLLGIDKTLYTQQFSLRINPTAYEHQPTEESEEEQ